MLQYTQFTPQIWYLANPGPPVITSFLPWQGMREPAFWEYAVLVFACLAFALAGLYILANFTRLFRGAIRNELLRKNLVALLAITCLSAALSPLSSGFFYMLQKHGWLNVICAHMITSFFITLIVFNLSRIVAAHPRVRALPFIWHQLCVMLTVVISTLAVNMPVNHYLYYYGKEYLKFSVISSIYIGGAASLVYAAISYLDLERKKKIDEKELELSRLRELKTKAELDALHSKINPHFLYNALNSIADLSVTDGKKARKMTVALADLFRYSINYSDHNYSSVKDEVEMAEVYLQIEKIRFEDQLTYSLSIDPELHHYLVPRFVLQPVVENAVKHGLKATGKMTEITIEVKRSANGLELAIADNGPHFPAELLPGYGVRSMYDKLDLLFPGQYEVHFLNEPRKQVSIYINKLMKDEPVVQGVDNR